MAMNEKEYREFYDRVGQSNGWDFSKLKCRVEGTTPDLYGEVRRHCKRTDLWLDIGMGGGEAVLSIHETALLLVGIDLSRGMLRTAEANLSKSGASNVRFMQMDAEKLDFPARFFDVVSCRHSGFNASQVAKALAEEGTFLTQQVSEGDKYNLKRAFGRGQSYEDSDGKLMKKYIEDLSEAGLTEIQALEFDSAEYYQRPEGNRGGIGMKNNRIGNSALIVGEIGLGCMSLGTEEKKATGLIHEALERGVNLLDTSDLYDAGRNEELVGQAIRGRRDRVVLATKVGNRRIPGQEGWVWDPSRAYVLSAVKESLKRLGTDYIDLYQLHGGTIDDPIDETIEAFEQLKREGVIREYGISSIRPNVIREYVERSAMVSVMNPYSIVDRRAEEAVLPLLQENGISVIARGPLAGGALAANRQPVKGVPDYELAELVSLRERLQDKAFSGRSLTSLALRYSLSHPAVAVAIPGASSSEQLLQNLAAADVQELSEEEARLIRVLSKPNRYTLHR